MKKFYSLMLVVLSLFSCVLFSACGDKYANLSISFYSSNGEQITNVEFLLDRSQDDFEYPTQTIGIEFDGIEQKELGQIQVFSEPFELVEVSNYRYNGNMVFVDIRANMSSTSACLSAVHMSSGKKQSVPLIIEQKSSSLIVNQNLTYIISIPNDDVEGVEHYVDINQLVNLEPAGSTDKLFFKTNSLAPAGTNFIQLKANEQYADLGDEYDEVYTGFNVTSAVRHGTTIEIYPVEYIKGYKNQNIDAYKNDETKQITIKFIKTLNPSSLALTNTIDASTYEVTASNSNPLKLIANDLGLKSIILTPKLKVVSGEDITFDDLNGEDYQYLKNYKLECSSTNKEVVSGYADEAKNNIVITAHLSGYPQTITITLSPKNSVGDIEPVSLSLIVEGILRADVIKVMKDKTQISTLDSVDILDFYSNNTPGALFNFEPATQLGAPVHERLSRMQIVVDKAMLSALNGGTGEYIHALSFYLLGRPLQFTEIEYLDGDEGKTYVAANITSLSNVYIKYVKTDDGMVDVNLQITVRTLSDFDKTETDRDNTKHFNGDVTTSVKIEFNLVAGVKSASIQAGTFTASDETYVNFDLDGQLNPKYVYLNKAEITQNAGKAYYIHIVNDSLLDMMDAKITGKLNFRAELVAVSKDIFNPLQIVNGFSVQQVDAETKGVEYSNPSATLTFEHNNTLSNDVVGFVINASTQVGEYILAIYQENNKIAETTIFVYETLLDLQTENVDITQNGNELKDNENIFKNNYEDYECDYIVATGQTLDFSVILHDNVLNSNFIANERKQNIVSSYGFKIDKEYDGSQGYAQKMLLDKNKFGIKFVQGSMIDAETKDYVTITISVELNTFVDILTIGSTESKELELTFFVFEKIEKTDASLSVTELFKQPENMLGAYVSNNSTDTLEIQMSESKWLYATAPTWKVENGNLGAISGNKVFVESEGDLKEDIYKYSIACIQAYNNFTSMVKVSFKQFDRVFEYSCLVHVNLPILTERITVSSEVLLTADEHETPYINLKDGETYTLKATQLSTSGEVTNKGLSIVIIDENARQNHTSNYFTISDMNYTISVLNVDNSHKFKLLVLPKDLLANEINSDTVFTSPVELFIDYAKSDENQAIYGNAFFMADIILSNGTKENPYLIKSAKEFFEIDDAMSLLQSHYQLQSNLDLSAYKNELPINNFSGSITTYGNNVYTLDGITLDNDTRNLFTNFQGEMFGVRFRVKYDYDISINTVDNAIYLGVFDKLLDTASLINVFVAMNTSNAKFTYGNEIADSNNIQVYFGGLVGENAGNISYILQKDGKTYQNLIGVYGQINLEDVGNYTTGIVFGGLAGKNIGTISGCLEVLNSADNEIVFATSGGSTQSVSNISLTSSLRNANSALGGIVGENNYTTLADGQTEDKIGVIQNAYVQANISASNTSNVGGVIGINNGVVTALAAGNQDVSIPENTSNKLFNIKSASTVYGKNNVGGITGFDNNGFYFDCDYQILDTLNNSKTAVKGATNVGGLVGKSTSGKFVFCSVMSYVWDYSHLESQNFTTPDILGDNNVGGLIGRVVSSDTNISPGADTNPERLVVAHSGVNAFARSSATGCVGGILTTEKGYSIIHNAYFIGKLEGAYDNNMLSDNDDLIKYVAAYGVNVIGMGAQAQIETTSIDHDDITNTNLPYWWQNGNLNGGFIFITKDSEPNDSSIPIFDIAPTSLSVKSKENENQLRLNYYDFSIDSKISEKTLNKLSKTYNQKSMADLLTFTVMPASVGKVVLKCASSNTQVVDISVDGTLIVNGVGNCTLTFTSVLNANIKASIEVVVEYPLGDFYIGTSALNFDKIVGTEQVAKGMSRQYYMLTKGSISQTNGTTDEFKYRTISSANLQVEVVFDGELSSVADYISITGTKVIADKSKAVYNINASTPFVISVLKQLESTEHFKVKVKPYYLDGNDITFYKNSGDEIETTFTLKTMAGVTNVAVSYNKSIVYLNDTITINLQFSSDMSFIAGLISQIDSWDRVNKTLANYAGVKMSIVSDNWAELSNNLLISVLEYDIENHALTLQLEFNKSIDFSIDAEKCFDLEIEINNAQSQKSTEFVNYTLLSQKIDRIDIKNYYYEKGDKVLYDILKAGEDNAGLIILDMVPENAYFDYLEISDITGNEEIVFIQLTEEHGTSVTTSPDVSHDGKGIKLYHYDGMTTGRIFIKTQISNEYVSKQHMLEVRAYMSNDTLLYSQRKMVEVKMLPSVKIEYIRPNGVYDTNIANSDENTNPIINLANGASATVRITAKNTTEEFVPVLSGELASKFSLVHIVGDLYELRRNNSEIDASDINKTLNLTIEAYSYYEVGSYDIASCTMKFRITNFVIHSVSVNQSIDNANTTEIYGYYNTALKLEFYFAGTDISYYDTSADEPLYETIYRYNKDEEPSDSNAALKQIHSILWALNTGRTNEGNNPYLSIKSWKENSHKFEDYLNASDLIQLNGNTLKVQDGYNKEGYNVVNRYLSVDFDLKNTSALGIEQWEIQPASTTYDSGDIYYKISKQYLLNFREVTQWDKPTAVTSAEEFIKMKSGGNYILTKDIVLSNYSPLDVALVQFDGNGHTITIHGFDTFNNVEIRAGLFQTVYPTMTIKNVKVKYETQTDGTGNYTLGNVNLGSNSITYYDLCNNPDVAYTSAKFGGITAENEGIITNCDVSGLVALRASIVEQNTAENSSYSSDFYIGGLVTDNARSANGEYGYITHSTAKLQIFALANIGGFVYSNSGKIATSAVDGEATIYCYNTIVSNSNTLVVKNAGFVVNNTNEISMSYVGLQAGGTAAGARYGTMSAKDTSAGFVYSNSGKISDAYVFMSAAGINNNKFYGFVANNAGEIYRAFTYINGGTKPSKNDVMFADSKTENIYNSIEFSTNTTTPSGVDGLSTYNPLTSIADIEKYEDAGFVFGHGGAVWIEDYGTYPKLKSTTEKVENESGLLPILEVPDTDDTDGVNSVDYVPDYSSYGTKSNPFIITSLEDWNRFFNPSYQIVMTGYYRIVKDIDFGELGYYPITSNVTFRGNIEGNNMLLSGIMLYSTERLSSIGLFEKLEGNNEAYIKNEVRNLTLEASSVWASNTNAVGVLAGVIENFNVFNINITGSGNLVVVGKNAVGGLAGVVKGNSYINQISSNVSVNSTRASTQSTYSVYMSKNNQHSSSNLSNVYYAGAVAGILDLYSGSTFDINQVRNVNGNYYEVQNIVVESNNFVAVGDTVGAAFGFIGEQVKLMQAKVDVSGSIMGAQYSAGLVGENRGIIQDCSAILSGNIFENATNVVGGTVGFNLGGLISNVDAQFDAIKNVYDFTIGGIVGRNLYGIVESSHFDGNILAYYTGGIIGANYNSVIMLAAETGSGAMAADNKNNARNLVPSDYVQYNNGTGEILNLSNVTISKNTFENMLKNAQKCYTFQNPDKEIQTPEFKDYIARNRVMGVVVGISFDVENNVLRLQDSWQMEQVGETIVFNSGRTSLQVETEKTVTLVDNIDPIEDAIFTFEKVNTLSNFEQDKLLLMFLVGTKATSMNTWAQYSECYILVC